MPRLAPPCASTRGLVCALLLVAAPSASAAPSAALQLEWTAPAGCPGAAEVRALAAGVLGRPLAPGGAEATRVRARVVLADRGFALTIETRSAGGTDTRRLQDLRCSVLAEAAAVIAATAVDPSLALRAAAPAPGLSPETGADLVPPAPGVPASQSMSVGAGERAVAELVVPAPAVLAPREPGLARVAETDAPEPAASVVAGREARLRGALRLAGLADLGSAPGPTGGLLGTAALLGRLWRAELAGLWLAPRTTRLDPSLDVGARVGLLAGSLRGCLTPRVGRLEVPVCAGLELGALRGRGVGAGIGRPSADVLPWVAVQAGPGLIFAPVPRLALTLQVDLVVPVVGARFAVGGYGEVYRGGSMAARAALGLEVRFR